MDHRRLQFSKHIHHYRVLSEQNKMEKLQVWKYKNSVLSVIPNIRTPNKRNPARGVTDQQNSSTDHWASYKGKTSKSQPRNILKHCTTLNIGDVGRGKPTTNSSSPLWMHPDLLLSWGHGMISRTSGGIPSKMDRSNKENCSCWWCTSFETRDSPNPECATTRKHCPHRRWAETTTKPAFMFWHLLIWWAIQLHQLFILILSNTLFCNLFILKNVAIIFSLTSYVSNNDQNSIILFSCKCIFFYFFQIKNYTLINEVPLYSYGCTISRVVLI